MLPSGVAHPLLLLQRVALQVYLLVATYVPFTLVVRGRPAIVPSPQPQWTAYVIHTNAKRKRFLHSMSVLRAANVTAVPVRAVSKSSAWLLELFPECAAGKKARGYNCSLASNFLTQARVWQRMDRSGADADAYSLVIEDDIQRHSAVAPAAVRGLLDVAASASRQHGLPVFYAGICGHAWYGPGVHAHEGWHAGLLFSRVHGSCAHAYAVRHGDAAAMAARAIAARNATAFMDVQLNWLGQARGGFIAAGVNLRSPQDSRHRGIFYQDRAQFGANLN